MRSIRVSDRIHYAELIATDSLHLVYSPGQRKWITPNDPQRHKSSLREPHRRGITVYNCAGVDLFPSGHWVARTDQTERSHVQENADTGLRR